MIVCSFADAAAALSSAEENSSDALTSPLLRFLPVDGASISTIGDLLGTRTVAASDETVARIDELQFDLGEGPCWDALASAAPVLEPDLRRAPRRHWPAFSEAVRRHDVGALFAFPLVVGPLRIGAIDLYAASGLELGDERTAQTSALAHIVSRHVLRQALRDGLAEEPGEDLSPYSRRAIHQATGFVIAQCGISASDAQLLLRGHAFGEGRSVNDVAEDVVAGRLSFAADGSAIEEVR